MQTDTAATLTFDLPEYLNSASCESSRSNWRHELVLRPDDLTITVWSMYGNGTPVELWADRVIGLGSIPDGTADLSPVRAVLERHTAELLELAGMHEIVENRVGRYTDRDRANEISHEIHDAIYDAGAECARFWDAGEWLSTVEDSELFAADYDGSESAVEARAQALVNEARGDAALDPTDVRKELRRRWKRVLEARADAAAEAAELEADA